MLNISIIAYENFEKTHKLVSIEQIYRFSYRGFKLFAHRSHVYNKSWTVSEVKTGLGVISSDTCIPTKKVAIEKAQHSIDGRMALTKLTAKEIVQAGIKQFGKAN